MTTTSIWCWTISANGWAAPGERSEWRRTDRATVIADLIDGQYSNPVRVVAFNTAEGWSRDVSREFADQIARRCAQDGFDIPPTLESFVEQHALESLR